jgi:hypothetical protein
VAPARPGVKRRPGEAVDAPRLTKGFYHVNISDIGPTVQFVRISECPLIDRGDQPLATVSKRWFSMRDSYAVDVAPARTTC